jgi:hypothetical protein
MTLNVVTITDTGTAAFTGADTLSISSLAFSNGGETLSLGNTTTFALSSLTMDESGVYGITGGIVTDSSSTVLAAQQTLKLTDTTYSSSATFTGSGTLELNGATVSLANASNLSPTVQFDTVGNGGVGNTLIVGDDCTGLTITGLGYGDKIMVGSGDTLQLVSNSNGTYSLVDNHGSYSSTVASNVTLASNTNPNDFGMSNGYFEYTGTVACFMAGTMLAAANGEIAVEDVTTGTKLRTADGRVLPVRWVGQSHVSTRFADPLRALPIRITAGALGAGLPVRDLLVSPDHAVYLDGILVQAGALVNGTSIVREENVPEFFTYYHVELATHELLLAEGMPAESFVDNVDRMNFDNWNGREAPCAPIEEMAYPRAKSHRQLPVALRQMLAARASRLLEASAA